MFDVGVKRGNRTIATGKTNGPVTNKDGAGEIQVSDLQGVLPAGYLTLLLTDSRGGGAPQVFEDCQVSKWVNREAVFLYIEPERASDKAATCKAAKKNFEGSLEQLRSAVRSAKGQVDASPCALAQKRLFAEIADRILEGS
jgi:hypothetical protein